MKVIILIFCLFSIGFAVCNERYINNPSRTKINEETKEELEKIHKIIVNALGDGIKKFPDKSLTYNINLIIEENGEFCYYGWKKSNNEEYNKFIEDFMKRENGKIYYNNPKVKKININFKPE